MRAARQIRFQSDLMAEGLRGPADDRQPEAEALARRIDLMKRIEDRAELFGGNTGTGIQDLDREEIAPLAAPDQHPAAPGIFDGVAHQIADDGAQHAGIADDLRVTRQHDQPQAFGFGVQVPVVNDRFENIQHRKALELRRAEPGLQQRRFSQSVEFLGHAHSGVDRQTKPLPILWIRELVADTIDGDHHHLQRLLKIVAGHSHQSADIALQPVGQQQRAAKLYLRHDLTRQSSENVALFGRELPRFVVKHADGAERQTVGRAQQRAGVKPDMRFAGYQRITVEPRIPGGVGYFEKAVLKQRVGAERLLERRLANAETDFGFEPLPALVDQADERNRSLANVAGDPRDVVERGFDGSIEDSIGAQRLQPLRLVGMQPGGSRLV